MTVGGFAGNKAQVSSRIAINQCDQVGKFLQAGVVVLLRRWICHKDNFSGAAFDVSSGS
jgi:hypothetical protein